jgi:hypothetical protein
MRRMDLNLKHNLNMPSRQASSACSSTATMSVVAVESNATRRKAETGGGPEVRGCRTCASCSPPPPHQVDLRRLDLKDGDVEMATASITLLPGSHVQVLRLPARHGGKDSKHGDEAPLAPATKLKCGATRVLVSLMRPIQTSSSGHVRARERLFAGVDTLMHAHVASLVCPVVAVGALVWLLARVDALMHDHLAACPQQTTGIAMNDELEGSAIGTTRSV